MYKAQKNWLPLESARMVNKYMAYFFLFKAKDALLDKRMQYFCIHRCVDFMYEEELLELIVSWYTEHNGRIVIDGVELTMTVPTMIHYLLIKRAFKAMTITHEQKTTIQQIVFEGYLTDSAMRI